MSVSVWQFSSVVIARDNQIMVSLLSTATWSPSSVSIPLLSPQPGHYMGRNVEQCQCNNSVFCVMYRCSCVHSSIVRIKWMYPTLALLRLRFQCPSRSRLVAAAAFVPDLYHCDYLSFSLQEVTLWQNVTKGREEPSLDRTRTCTLHRTVNNVHIYCLSKRFCVFALCGVDW